MGNNRREKMKLRRRLKADALLVTVRNGFENVSDYRNSNATISLADALIIQIQHYV